MMSKTINNLLFKYKNILKNANIDSYSLDCELLLMKATNFDKLKLYTNLSYELNDKEFKTFEDYIFKRLKKEPIAYIINNCEFMGLNFYVNNNTLIPRADTEILVEKVINIINKNNLTNILEIGVGSGAISVSIANYCKNTKITAVDISKKALEIAYKNACTNSVSNNINFIKSNLFENVKNSKFDIIVSNPPYIKTKDIQHLDINVKDFEPSIALDGGKDGLYFYQKITKTSVNYLNPGGFLLYEIGYNQNIEVKEILKNNNFKNITTLKDLKGHNRVVYGNLS